MKKRIFIISKHLMFGRGLESLLREETSAEILGQAKDVSTALEKIERLKPDVVILDTNDTLSNGGVDILKILSAGPGIKVIGLSLVDNHLHVYQASRMIAKGVEDLVNAIEADPT